MHRHPIQGSLLRLRCEKGTYYTSVPLRNRRHHVWRTGDGFTCLIISGVYKLASWPSTLKLVGKRGPSRNERDHRSTWWSDMIGGGAVFVAYMSFVPLQWTFCTGSWQLCSKGSPLSRQTPSTGSSTSKSVHGQSPSLNPTSCMSPELNSESNLTGL